MSLDLQNHNQQDLQPQIEQKQSQQDSLKTLNAILEKNGVNVKLSQNQLSLLPEYFALREKFIASKGQDLVMRKALGDVMKKFPKVFIDKVNKLKGVDANLNQAVRQFTDRFVIEKKLQDQALENAVKQEVARNEKERNQTSVTPSLKSEFKDTQKGVMQKIANSGGSKNVAVGLASVFGATSLGGGNILNSKDAVSAPYVETQTADYAQEAFGDLKKSLGQKVLVGVNAVMGGMAGEAVAGDFTRNPDGSVTRSNNGVTETVIPGGRGNQVLIQRNMGNRTLIYSDSAPKVIENKKESYSQQEAYEETYRRYIYNKNKKNNIGSNQVKDSEVLQFETLPTEEIEKRTETDSHRCFGIPNNGYVSPYANKEDSSEKKSPVLTQSNQSETNAIRFVKKVGAKYAFVEKGEMKPGESYFVYIPSMAKKMVGASTEKAVVKAEKTSAPVQVVAEVEKTAAAKSNMESKLTLSENATVELRDALMDRIKAEMKKPKVKELVKKLEHKFFLQKGEFDANLTLSADATKKLRTIAKSLLGDKYNDAMTDELILATFVTANMSLRFDDTHTENQNHSQIIDEARYYADKNQAQLKAFFEKLNIDYTDNLKPLQMLDKAVSEKSGRTIVIGGGKVLIMATGNQSAILNGEGSGLELSHAKEMIVTGKDGKQYKITAGYLKGVCLNATYVVEEVQPIAEPKVETPLPVEKIKQPEPFAIEKNCEPESTHPDYLKVDTKKIQRNGFRIDPRLPQDIKDLAGACLLTVGKINGEPLTLAKIAEMIGVKTVQDGKTWAKGSLESLKQDSIAQLAKNPETNNLLALQTLKQVSDIVAAMLEERLQGMEQKMSKVWTKEEIKADKAGYQAFEKEKSAYLNIVEYLITIQGCTQLKVARNLWDTNSKATMTILNFESDVYANYANLALNPIKQKLGMLEQELNSVNGEGGGRNASEIYKDIEALNQEAQNLLKPFNPQVKDYLMVMEDLKLFNKLDGKILAANEFDGWKSFEFFKQTSEGTRFSIGKAFDSTALWLPRNIASALHIFKNKISGNGVKNTASYEAPYLNGDSERIGWFGKKQNEIQTDKAAKPKYVKLHYTDKNGEEQTISGKKVLLKNGLAVVGKDGIIVDGKKAYVFDTNRIATTAKAIFTLDFKELTPFLDPQSPDKDLFILESFNRFQKSSIGKDLTRIFKGDADCAWAYYCTKTAKYLGINLDNSVEPQEANQIDTINIANDPAQTGYLVYKIIEKMKKSAKKTKQTQGEVDAPHGPNDNPNPNQIEPTVDGGGVPADGGSTSVGDAQDLVGNPDLLNGVNNNIPQPSVTPAPETVVTSPVAETVVTSPVAETVVTSPITETIVPSPITETVVTSPVTETIVTSPVAETVVNNPVTENIVTGGATEIISGGSLM